MPGGSTAWRLPPSSLLTQSSTDAKEADLVGGAQPGGTALSGGHRRPRRDERDRRGPAQRGEPPERPHLAPALCQRRPGGTGRQELEARDLSAPDGAAHRSQGGRAATGAPALGTTLDPHPARQRRVHSGPWTLVHLSHPGPSPPLRTDATQALALGLQALGALSLHGAVADGRRRALPSSRRHRGQGRHRRRRPLTLLRLRPRGRPGHGETGVRGLAVGAAHPWCARPDPDRQRQGFHGSLRPRARTCPFRQDLRQQRHPSSPHRSVFTDDNGQGRTLPQDHALGLLGRPRPGARDHRGAPKRSRRMGGRIQHRTSAPVSGRSTTPRALRSGCAPSGRSRDARGPRRGSALKAATRSQPLGRPSAARSPSEGSAIGWERPSPGSPSRSWCAQASSRSSTTVCSSLPTPSVARRTKNRGHNAPSVPDAPGRPLQA